MVSQKVTVKNPTGLHLRPAGILCKEAMQFKSHITFRYRENTANAKSVLSVLGACIKSCLLYTSPSPRDRQKSRMPSSA